MLEVAKAICRHSLIKYTSQYHSLSTLKGRSALDAVEAATRSMEDCGVLNAGRGSYLTEEGTVELDALIMDGQTLNTGKLITVLYFYFFISTQAYNFGLGQGHLFKQKIFNTGGQHCQVSKSSFHQQNF